MSQYFYAASKKNISHSLKEEVDYNYLYLPLVWDRGSHPIRSKRPRKRIRPGDNFIGLVNFPLV